MKYRFFYSKKQAGNDCDALVKTPEGFKKYSEMRSDGGGSNWDDAVLVYESDECPEIDPNLCGYCSRCEFLCKEEGDDYIYIPDDDFTTGRG
jgi:hypothetical protein